MTPRTRRSLSLLLVGAVVVTGFQLADRAEVAQELDAAEAVSERWRAELDEAATGRVPLDARMAELRHTSATYVGLLDARQDFVTSLGAVAAAFTIADGKVDTAAQRAGILTLQQRVLSERSDVGVVTDAVGEADGVAAAVATAVEDHDREQARLLAQRAASAAASSSRGRDGGWAGSSGAAAGPVAGGYDRVRAALDRVGGAHVRLEEFSGACGGGSAAARASPGVIRFAPGLATWPDGRLHWAMAHELAHIHQFDVWGTLVASGGYSSLFGGDIELLANCMAAQRGYGSGNVSCSGAQLQWAGAIWGGVVPG